jgi:large subunit ribosomal protein L31
LYICSPKLKNPTFARALVDKTQKKMKPGIHPENYRFVVFKDLSNDYAFLTKSCVESKETIKWEDGNEYPVVKLEISHMSHPFYTGKVKLVDTAGRVDKFRSRYKKAEPKTEEGK